MGRGSIKENKSEYQLCREEQGLTREKASEIISETFPISANKIEKIENDRATITPGEVLAMSEGYKAPQLCNYYCANECPIGTKYVPDIKIKDLSIIVLEMLASLNSMKQQQDRLIEISADGKITEDELQDFVEINKQLKRISIAAESLYLWSEKMIADGTIDEDEFNRLMND